MADEFLTDKETHEKHLRVIRAKIDDDYVVDDKFKPSESSFLGCHSTPEMVSFLDSHPECEVDATVLFKEATKGGKVGYAPRQLNRREFLEAYRKGDQYNWSQFKEDDFAFDNGFNPALPNQIGVDFVPLLGGPFYKQLYYYDYLRMHSLSFYALNHDPAARRVVYTIRDFTLGRGWRADVSHPNKNKQKVALALWRAFEEANDLYNLFDSLAIELSTYGENMLWELPNNQAKIGWQDLLSKGQNIPKAIIPRYRLIDPSVIWEIITYPEDITRVLAYQWVAPTQYQIYTKTDKDSVPSSKFIFKQIPGDQVIHTKINSVSNEKRGRSDLFPILGYLKRLRDSVNYSIVAAQKTAAWCIDTTLEGSQADIDAYIQSQQQLGEFAPAGSEFVHTSKVKREYMNNASRGGGDNPSFQWCLDMIAMGSGIPVSYFGTHQHAGSSRATALVATEPVAKLFEKRQFVYELIMKKVAARLFQKFGLGDCELEVTFPEIILQDRSAKLQDLQLAEEMQWISHEKAATIGAKELGITEYEYDEEQATIDTETPKMQPLSQPGKVGVKKTLPQPPATQPTSGAGSDEPSPSDSRPSAVTSADRRQVSMNR